MATVADQMIARAAASAGFPRDQIATAVAVALAESGGNATATNRNSNGTTDHGLWQINSVHTAELAAGNWQDPTDNARMAFAVWSRAGRQWSPWYAWRNARHLPFMPRGAAAASALGDFVDLGKPPDQDPGNNPLIPDPIEGPVDAAAAWWRQLGRVVAVLRDRDLYVRAGLYLLGAALLGIGAVALLWTLGGGRVIKTVGKVIT